MSELTGLGLRKAACEVMGWTRQEISVGDYYHHPKCKTKARGVGHRVQGCGPAWCSLPCIESESAVSEPMFLEFCENRYVWTAEDIYDSARGHWFRYALSPMSNIEVEYVGEGTTPSEARARAIVAAGPTVAKSATVQTVAAKEKP